jgi:hypothetical protein
MGDAKGGEGCPIVDVARPGGAIGKVRFCQMSVESKK